MTHNRSTVGPVQFSSRQFAAVLIGGFAAIIFVGLLLSGALDPALTWSDSWATVLQAFGSLILTAALVYLYHQQRSILQSQTDIMDDQEQLMVSQYRPTLFQTEWEFGDSCPYDYMTGISNESENLAHALYLRFDLYLDQSAVQQNPAARVVDDPARSGEDVYSLVDLVFAEDATVRTIVEQTRSPVQAPLTITDNPKLLSIGQGSQFDGKTIPVSKLSPGERTVLTSSMSHEIESHAAPDRTRIFHTLPFEEVASYLADLGFEKLYVWIGVEYLDPIGKPHSLTFHTRTLDIYKPHYASNPFSEWRHPAEADLDGLRTAAPRHPER